MEITIKPAYQEQEAIRELFTEYTDMVVENDPDFAGYLKLQRYDAELNNLAEKYGQPGGRLYLVRVDGAPAGCIAMKRLDETKCEMKRLYIRPAFRGKGIARRLVTMLLADAQEEGYQAMLLDTFPFLKGAIRLYQELGFYEIPSYNNSPLDSTIYMRKDLPLA
ncbi:MAG: GNAT family N-acetyltransferase [Evtepia sp.]|uniref:GNAT family N-acetyltransferase n=1 Tax=Evtepia sp. TaxID=2773933 RepID=UPI002A74A583|nr:GNAT family N-acetyltransferase [Evtepia sp.]MDY3014546.1 GNAT family N-acetyltransferase [Evtepia sp.]